MNMQLTRSSKFVSLSHSTGRIPEVLDSLIHNIGDHEFEEIFTSSCMRYDDHKQEEGAVLQQQGYPVCVQDCVGEYEHSFVHMLGSA